MRNNKRQVRRVVTEGLERYLVGPHKQGSSGAGTEHEIIPAGTRYSDDNSSFRDQIDQSPHQVYQVGVLFPAEEKIECEDDDQTADDADSASGPVDSSVALSNALRQAAMGLTVRLAPGVTKLNLTVSWGTYFLVAGERHIPESMTDSASGQVEESVWLEEGQPLFWQRRPERIEQQIDLSSLGDRVSLAVISAIDNGGVEVIFLQRQHKGDRLLTVTLVNRRTRTQCEEVGENWCVFQAAIEIGNTETVCFLPSTDTGMRSEDDDEYWNLELLYRDSRQYGVGHGVSVSWEKAASGDAAILVRTEWLPQLEVPKAATDSLGDTSPLAIDFYAEAESLLEEEIIDRLRVLPDEYESWISAQKASLPSRRASFAVKMQSHVTKAAARNLRACETQRERMIEGIQLLEANNNALQAFCLMNRAISHAMRRARPDDEPRWRPFQLAFILLALPSVSDRDHADREIFDLIWFPTGGGKTEAYLGLTAFTLFYRYLKYPAARAAGTAILTRYTLRLLTAQQFERSALTIAACEVIRRTVPELSAHPPFTIGMLVGRDVTPNWLKKAREYADGKKKDGDRATLLPLERCPWCGTRLEERRISVDLENRTIITPCPKSDCDFSDGLPIVVVDEAIYESPPTFVIATIDKLAQLSSVPDMSKILGRDTKHDPPDLIIQDELHLINDALGTVAALFEMATEFLATNADGSLPKLVGSTATIRQADHQIRCLYRKSLMQFPPNGISISDSFFYRTDTDNPGRLYLGIHAQGKSPKHTLSVVLALLAQLPQRISDKEERDPFHTVVAYFNSLRELGGAHALAEDDVQRLLDQLPLEAGERKRILTYIVELTSQLQSEDIKSIFSQLEVELHGENDSSEPLDLVLASNMISVGVDIDRLGLMVVNGQPKTTSEYIQATSRIGRRAGSAGLVVTIYNWTRPRDRSHYERFTGYHETFYRYVEAVSVTPFAARARERALTAALVAMMRGSEYFRSNKLDLTRIANLKYSNTAEHALVQSIKDKLRDRVTSVEPDALKATLGEFEEFIDEIIQQAEHCVKMDKSLYWLEPSDEEPRGDTILQRSDGSNNRGYGRIIPLSMRDVDPPVPVVSLRR